MKEYGIKQIGEDRNVNFVSFRLSEFSVANTFLNNEMSLVKYENSPLTRIKLDEHTLFWVRKPKKRMSLTFRSLRHQDEEDTVL